MEKRYAALRIISVFYKAIAIFLFIITILSAIGAALVASGPSLRYVSGSFVTVPNPNPLPGAALAFVGTLLAGSILSISIYAFANIIDLFVHTEENTRMTALLLNRLVRQQGNTAGPLQT